MTERVLIGMTGATGQRYGIRALELLADTAVEAHLVHSDASLVTLRQETDYAEADLHALADEVYDVENIGAPPASGSFPMRGMLVAPCSMKTLSNIANGNAGSLITRSADVALKERRRLVLLPRETPLNRIHLENMLTVTDAGGIVAPPLGTFYNRPSSIDEMVTNTVARALRLFDVDVDIAEWRGLDETA